MSARRTMLAAAAAVVSLARVGAAQRDSAAVYVDSAARALACPVNGILLHPRPGGGASSTPSDARTVLDTTITLSIADRTWTRSDVDVGVALGVSGAAGAGPAPWRACAGAAAHLGTVTAHLHDVNGTIRLHADPGALDAMRQPPADSLRRTTPAVPPRR